MSVTSTGRRGWVALDRRWLADPDLSDSALRLMLWLESHTHEYLRDLNARRIADELGWSRARVKRTLDDLERLSLVSCEQIRHPEGGKTRTLVTLHLDAWSRMQHGVTNPPEGMQHGVTQGMQHDEATTTSTSNSRKATEAHDVGELFDAFWKKYPNIKNRKVGKQKAKAKFVQIAKRGDLDELRDGARYWFHQWATDPEQAKYCPQPYNWLHLGAWTADARSTADTPTGPNLQTERTKWADMTDEQHEAFSGIPGIDPTA